ncbi:hypothetical protein [Polaromonas sp. CG9_12]|uniref:hypothetical protein n=1 Tax=Polaromonas sp. CG_9.11 TaxID=2787730 RepID=UPI0004DDC9F7|nr:hypothetical protein [Polaromonas sp. CG_9.11]MBG6075087.1 chitinase [Polaromonas sp. CG_9.11]CDS55108.1 hypothetical protein [Polaromonas sp. CG9_12]
MPKRNFAKIFSVATAAVLLSLGQSARALEIAPYFHAWSGGTLTEAKRVAGLDSATLAFAITKGTCSLDQDLLNKLPDARTYVGAGGQLIISFGGQNGVYAEIACKDDNQLFNLLDRLIVDSGTRRIDWDVEGHQLLDVDGTARRTRVLVRLQAKYPDLYTSFTLPGWLRGVDANSMNLLKTTIAAGVRISMVNVMTMSFGLENLRTMVVPSTVAQASIMTFRAAVSQMATLYPNKTQAQLHAMMGMTPMIGKNDDGSTFSLVDAKTIADFAKANGIGLLSYWSFQRDQAQASNASTDLGSFSGVAQSNYQFLNIFKTAGGSVVPTPTPTVTVTSSPTPVSTCGSSAWVQGKQYAVGSIVSYSNGTQYKANFANPGYDPTISTYFWSQYICAVSSTASIATAPAPAPIPAPAPTCSSSAWVQGKQYAAGSIVSYSNGTQYKANFANPGYDPTISTYFWSQYICAVSSTASIATAPAPAPIPAPAPTCNSSTWTQGKQYSAGSVVTYSNGLKYKANFANPGYNPTISTYFWSRYAC